MGMRLEYDGFDFYCETKQHHRINLFIFHNMWILYEHLHNLKNPTSPIEVEEVPLDNEGIDVESKEPGDKP